MEEQEGEGLAEQLAAGRCRREGESMVRGVIRREASVAEAYGGGRRRGRGRRAWTSGEERAERNTVRVSVLVEPSAGYHKRVGDDKGERKDALREGANRCGWRLNVRVEAGWDSATRTNRSTGRDVPMASLSSRARCCARRY
jgi:hypothetical protein